MRSSFLLLIQNTNQEETAAQQVSKQQGVYNANIVREQVEFMCVHTNRKWLIWKEFINYLRVTQDTFTNIYNRNI